MQINDKDIYTNLLNFADDRTIIHMLSVNKKFNDDIFFERVMRRKYPLLLEFRNPDESYKKLYLRMVKYIAKLEEEFEIPYISGKYNNPEIFYKMYNRHPKTIYIYAMYRAVEARDIEMVKLLFKKIHPRYYNVSINSAIKLAEKYRYQEIIDYLKNI